MAIWMEKSAKKYNDLILLKTPVYVFLIVLIYKWAMLNTLMFRQL